MMCASMEDEGLKECEGIIKCLSSKRQYAKLGKGLRRVLQILPCLSSIFHKKTKFYHIRF
jgi:hypothetical protein